MQTTQKMAQKRNQELDKLASTQELIDWVMIDFVSEDAVSEDNQLEGLTFEDIKPYVSMYKSTH